MVIWIVLVVLVVLCVVGYVNRGEPWAQWMLIVCCVGAVGVIIARATLKGGQGDQAGITRRVATEAAGAAELLGGALREHVEPGTRMLVLAEFSPTVRPGWPLYWSSRRDGLTKGLGDIEWQYAGYFGPTPGTAASLSAGLDQMAGEFDVVVSFNGLPADLEQMSIYGYGDVPMVAAVFPLGTADKALIRTWLTEDYLQAAVVEEERGSFELYTKSELP